MAVAAQCSDLVQMLPGMMLGYLALYSLGVCSLGSGLAANHIPYIGARIAPAKAGTEKARTRPRVSAETNVFILVLLPKGRREPP